MSRYLLMALFIAHIAAARGVAQTATVAVSGSVVMQEGAVWPNFSISFANRFAGKSTVQARGTFRVNLLQGAYDVEVSGLPSGYTVRSITVGSSDLSKNQLLVMRDEAPPQVLVMVEVSSPPPWVKVNGHVISERTPITPGLRISMSSPVSDPVVTGVSADGSFEFPRLLPAVYSASFVPAPSWSTPFSITVLERDLTGVQLALPQVNQVSGRIVVDDGGPIPVTSLTLTPGSNVIRPGVRNQIFINLSPQPDGRFKVSLPEGQYGMSVTPQTRKPDGTNLYSVKALTYGDVDLLRDPAVIAAADSELRLTFAPATPNSFVKVKGSVTGLETLVSASTGLPGVRTSPQVTLSGAGLVGSLSAALNPDGTFEFPRVYTGNYSVRLASSPLPANVTIPSVSLIVAGKDVTDLAISIPRVREITGRIILDGSGPMPRFNFPIVPMQPATGQSNRTININSQADGSFKLTLPESEGRVGAIAGLPPGYRVTSFMYGSTDLLKDPLKVAATDTAELRATIATSGAVPVEVRGRVSGLDGVAVTGVPVNVTLITAQYLATLNATVRSDGLFVFPEVYPGNYTASVRGPGISSSPAVPVVVTSAGTAELDIPLPGQKDVAGRVIVEGGGSPPVFLLPSTPVSVPQGINGVSSTIPAIRPFADGSFHVILPEGERRFGPFINLPPGFTVKSATYGSVELMSNSVRIARTDTAELRITLISSFVPVNVSGKVTGLDDSDPARFTVRVTLTSPSYAVALTQSIQPDGSFTFQGVSPGSYTLRLTGARLPPGMPAKTIEVANSEVRDISYVVPGQKEVIGRVVIEGGGPSPRLTLRLGSGELEPQVNSMSLVPITPQSDGMFRITLPVGQRAADIQLPAGFTLQAFKYGDTDLRTNPVKVSSDDKAEIAITIKSSVPGSWAKVSGRVIGMDPTASGVLVSLTGSSFPQLLNASVNPDGTFQFPQVFQGNYTARLLGPIGASVPQPVTVNVASKDVTDVAIVVARQFIVRGRLVISGDKNARNNAMMPIAVEARRPGGQIISSAIATDAFTLSLETGDQTIAVGNVPPGYQLQSAIYGSTDLLKGPLRVNGPLDGEVVLTLKTLTSSPPVRLSSISGHVTGDTSRIPAPRKLLISGPRPTDLHEVEIGSNGAFKLKDISPGTYTIRVSGVSASSAAPETVVVSGKNVSNVKIAVH